MCSWAFIGPSAKLIGKCSISSECAQTIASMQLLSFSDSSSSSCLYSHHVRVRVLTLTLPVKYRQSQFFSNSAIQPAKTILYISFYNEYFSSSLGEANAWRFGIRSANLINGTPWSCFDICIIHWWSEWTVNWPQWKWHVKDHVEFLDSWGMIDKGDIFSSDGVFFYFLPVDQSCFA